MNNIETITNLCTQLEGVFYLKHFSVVYQNFKLDRGVPIEESGRKHLDLKEYKEITNFDKTKEKLQNIKLDRIIDKFYETIDKFIYWICKKFDMGAEDNLIRDFQKETHTLLDAEQQIKRQDKEKEWDLEK